MPREGETVPLSELPGLAVVDRVHLSVVEGPSAGKSYTSEGAHCSVGSHASNDVMLDDPAVSRFHCELRMDARGPLVRDLESRNGTILDGVHALEAFARDGSMLRVGRSVIQLHLGAERVRLPLSAKTELGPLVGRSVAMRAAFALMERAAATEATVLLEGETGTGKEGAALAIHQESERRDGPFMVVDCGAIPPALLESQLFGHEKGSFTGASARQLGTFEEAAGGTIFLDEVGELPPDLQPKLLRVLERREIRRLGTNRMLPVDVRVVSATNRDLRTEVNAGRFRADLYYRLAVVRIALPPLRQRLDDLPLLVDRVLEQLATAPETAAVLRSPDLLARLARGAWPGNVRELRNYLERCIVFQQPLPLADVPRSAAPSDVQVWDYSEARRLALDAFERRYLESMLARHNGKVAQAAQEAGVARAHLYRMMGRHNLVR